MSNFAFLEEQWGEIGSTARQAERYVNSDPCSACFYSRRALEQAVAWLFEHDQAFKYPYDDNLVTLLTDNSFKENVPAQVVDKSHLIRKLGNTAVHTNRTITTRDALIAVRELFHVLYWLGRTYTRSDPQGLPTIFDENLIPPSDRDLQKRSAAQLRQLDEELTERDEQLRQQSQSIADYEVQIAALQERIAQFKAANATIHIQHEYTEAETREYLIDVYLREAGWNPQGSNVAEYEVTGMPNSRRIGYVDYVLWGDDGLPLGLVEAKNTSIEPQQGKQQAKLYANCLEKMHGQRPVIFYSNGYQTWIWDDHNYPPRLIQGFYTKDELQLIIQRRSIANNLREVPTNSTIVDRYYQEAAVRGMCEHFSMKHRRGLLVMATGTGKTRVAIALVDVLMRANQVKRVLFLADRTALVRQAVNAFRRYLPESQPVNLLELDNKAEAIQARVVVSTYHTMMGMIDEVREDGEKRFGSGHFDLLIIDEAHRSIYIKFGAIFDYFDSLLIGLTATPKNEVDRNTYRLFNLADGVPNYAYNLEQAVADGYLVPHAPSQFPCASSGRASVMMS